MYFLTRLLPDKALSKKEINQKYLVHGELFYLLLRPRSVRLHNPLSRFTRKPILWIKYQPKHNVHTRPDRHFSPPVDFLLQESILLTFIPPETECIDRRLCRLLWVDTLRIVHNVGFLMERLICIVVNYINSFPYTSNLQQQTLKASGQ